MKSSVAFLGVGLFGLLLGTNEIFGMSYETGRDILYVFIALAVGSFLYEVVARGRSERAEHPPT